MTLSRTAFSGPADIPIDRDGRVTGAVALRHTAKKLGGWMLAAALSIAAPALATPEPSGPEAIADFSREAASAEARQVANWVLASSDNQGLPFIIVDKAHAKLFLFDGGGEILAASPVLLGLARGDDSPPGIGNRKLSLIKPEERITPAGRFVAAPGLNLSGQDILWVDYEAAISLHRATDRKPGLTSKSRMERLSSASVLDNRISHGCINVSARFFEDFIRTTFMDTTGIVYVLPETRSVSDVFGIDDPATLS